MLIIAAAPTIGRRPGRAGGAGRVLPHQRPRLLREELTAEALVDGQGTELAASDCPPAQTAPGDAAAAAAAVRAAAAPPRAASRAAA